MGKTQLSIFWASFKFLSYRRHWNAEIIQGAENLDFIAAVDSYKAGKETAQNIYDLYVREGSNQQINISSAERAEIGENVAQAPNNLFNRSQATCRVLLRNNYLGSNTSSDWLKTAEGMSAYHKLGGKAEFGE